MIARAYRSSLKQCVGGIVLQSIGIAHWSYPSAARMPSVVGRYHHNHTIGMNGTNCFVFISIVCSTIGGDWGSGVLAACAPVSSTAAGSSTMRSGAARKEKIVLVVDMVMNVWD
jgi:hypothetical protein